MSLVRHSIYFPPLSHHHANLFLLISICSRKFRILIPSFVSHAPVNRTESIYVARRSSPVNSIREYSVVSSRLGSFRSLNRARPDESAPLNLLHQPQYSSLKQMNPFEEQHFYEWEKKRKCRKGIRRRRKKKRSSDQPSTAGFVPPANSDPDSVIVVNADDSPTNESTSRQSFY